MADRIRVTSPMTNEHNARNACQPSKSRSQLALLVPAGKTCPSRGVGPVTSPAQCRTDARNSVAFAAEALSRCYQTDGPMVCAPCLDAFGGRAQNGTGQFLRLAIWL